MINEIKRKKHKLLYDIFHVNYRWRCGEEKKAAKKRKSNDIRPLKHDKIRSIALVISLCK